MDRQSYYVALPVSGLPNEQRHGLNDPWVPFIQTHLNLNQLLELCQSDQQLRKEGYVRHQLLRDELKARQRCIRCTARTSYRPQRPDKEQSKAAPELALDGTPELGETAKREELSNNICCYHPGPFIKQICQCCTKRSTQAGCKRDNTHQYGDPEDPAYLRFWQFRQTPNLTTENAWAVPDMSLSAAYQPALLSQTKQRLAIALDCEMGTAATGDSELIRLSAIDVFSKETLIDKIVKPEVEMRHLNTKYSGVTWKDIRHAKARGDCFQNKEAARQALFRFVGPNTIIVTHGGSHDFSVLRWIHPHIIDTFILYQNRREKIRQAEQLVSDVMEAKQLNITVEEVQQRREAKAEADKLARAAALAATKPMDGSPEPKKSRREKRAPSGLSLKALVKEYANIDIQTGYGHNSLEDAFGCRELAIRFILTEPEVSQYLARCSEPSDTG